MSAHAPLVVLAGGPGSGKTTLAERLAAEGFHAAPAGGRAIIRDQVAIGGRGVPWDDAGSFAELMLQWDLRSYRWAQQLPPAGPVFFDHPMMPSANRALTRRGRLMTPSWPDTRMRPR